MAAFVTAVTVYAAATIGAATLGVYVGTTIGAMIGAGIAGGLMAEVKGGDFWDGFVMSAATTGVMGAMGYGPGATGAEGAGGLAGTEGGVYGADGSFTPDASTFGMGDAPIGEVGMGDLDLSGVSASQGPGFNEIGTNTSYGFDNTNTASYGADYQDVFNPSVGSKAGTGFNVETYGPSPNLTAGNPNTGYTAPGTDVSNLYPPNVQAAQAQAQSISTPQVTDTYAIDGASNSSGSLGDFGGSSSSGGGGGGGNSWTSGGGGGGGGWDTDAFNPNYNINSSQYSLGGDQAGPMGGTMTGGGPAETNWWGGTSEGMTGGLKDMFASGDTALGEWGLPKGSTAMLGMQGGMTLYDMYNAKKMEDMAAGMKPMSFEEYQTQRANLPGMKNAYRNMARAGRTGLAPLATARARANTRQAYEGYAGAANQRADQARMAAMNAQSSALSSIPRTLGSMWMMNQGRG